MRWSLLMIGVNRWRRDQNRDGAARPVPPSEVRLSIRQRSIYRVATILAPHICSRAGFQNG